MRMRVKQKTVFKKKGIFLGLMQWFRLDEVEVYEVVVEEPEIISDHPYGADFSQFNKHYTPLLSTFQIFEYAKFGHLKTTDAVDILLRRSLHYYAKLSRFSKRTITQVLPRIYFNTYTINNFIVFSRPTQQLFVMFFREKPIFIFTCGQMRHILNEKRKCSKKLFKVAVSLMKLSSILLARPAYMPPCYIRLCDVGVLRSRILHAFYKNRSFTKVHYVMVKIPIEMYSQRFKSRAAVKKYVQRRINREK